MAGTWQESAESMADDAETRVKHAALDSFSKYRRVTHYNVTHRRRQNFYALPQAQWQMLAKPPFNYQAKLDRVDDAIDANAKIADQIVAHSIEAFGIETDTWKGNAKSEDHDKARSTIRQFYRDWSAEGEAERRACLKPVLDDLQRLFPQKTDRDRVKVLIPGAGLGRLLVELVAAGFEVEGNELSFHQLMASNFVLNGIGLETNYQLYPWALSFSNQVSADHQLESVTIPDLHPAVYLQENSEGQPRHAFERMSMTAGDFCLLYAEPEYENAFQAVATVFFIDTAPNVLRYIDTIRNVLTEGGHWINLGPLLWHFENRGLENDKADAGASGLEVDSADQDLGSKGIADPGSFELTADEVLALVANTGFEILSHEIREEGQGYIQDVSSMMTTSYKVLHFVAVRRPEAQADLCS